MRAYPLALRLAEDASSQVQPLSQAWRERTNGVIAKVDDAEPLRTANKRGCCRHCGVGRCIGDFTAGEAASFDRCASLLRRMTVFAYGGEPVDES